MTTPVLPDDKNLERDRIGRWLVLILSAVVLPIATTIASIGVTTAFAQNALVIQISAVVGFAAGIIAFMAIKHRFFVTNNSTGVLVTINQLNALLGRDTINTTYGPGGPHVAYPWEARLAENNISTKEATNNYDFVVQCRDGVLKGKGSYRLQPDPENPIAFLNGVAAVAEDLRSLLVAEIVNYLSKKDVVGALKALKLLNRHLGKKFAGAGHQKTALEIRFGVYVGDVTVDELLPSEDMQKTINALAETQVASQGAAILLGMTPEEVKSNLTAGTLSESRYDKALRNFMSISGNFEGMDIKRFEVDITGDKDIAEAITTLLRNTPPAVLQGLAAKAGNTKGTKK